MTTLRHLLALLVAVVGLVAGIVAPVFTYLALWNASLHDGRIAFVLWMTTSVSMPLAKLLVK